MSHPLDDCMLFVPDPDGHEGHYHQLGPFGWIGCTREQDAFLQANEHLHVAAESLRDLDHPDDERHSWGAMRAFKTFVVPRLTRPGARCCSRCGLPGHNRRTCTRDEAGEWVVP